MSDAAPRIFLLALTGQAAFGVAAARLFDHKRATQSGNADDSRARRALATGLLLFGTGFFGLTRTCGNGRLLQMSHGMSVFGGVIVTIGSIFLLCSRTTTATLGDNVCEALVDVSLLSSPFGVLGGALGAFLFGTREDARCWSTMGNILQSLYGLLRFANAQSCNPASFSVNDEKVVDGATFRMSPGTEAIFVNGGEDATFQSLVSCVSERTHAAHIFCEAKLERHALEQLANATGREIGVRAPGGFCWTAPKFESPFLSFWVCLMNPAAALSVLSILT